MQESEIGEWVRRYKSETEGDKKKKKKKKKHEGRKTKKMHQKMVSAHNQSLSHIIFMDY